MAAKLLWRGAECWKESLMLLNVAEAAARLSGVDDSDDSFIVRRRFVLLSFFNVRCQEF